MDLSLTLVVAIVGTVTGVVAAGVAVVAYRRSRTQDSPLLRIDSAKVEIPEIDTVPRVAAIGVTNTGKGMAQDIEIDAWIFFPPEGHFKVPDADSLSHPHYSGIVRSLRPDEEYSLEAIRSAEAYRNGEIPDYDPDNLLVIRIRAKYTDRFGNRQVEEAVKTGPPPGHHVTGYDRTPPTSQ